MSTPPVIQRAPINQLKADSFIGNSRKPATGNSFLGEAVAFLLTMRTRFRARRRFGDVLHVEVVEEILSDAQAVQAKAAMDAYNAEQSDHEARTILVTVLADGQVTPEEIPALRRAERHILNSATMDRSISDALSA